MSKKTKKLATIFTLFITLCICSALTALAAEFSEEETTAIMQQERVGAQGSNQGDFNSNSADLNVDMRATNTNAKVCVQVVAANSADFDKMYNVTWTDSRGIEYSVSVKANGEKKYYTKHGMTVHKGVNKFHYYAQDNVSRKFYASVRIENPN